MDKEKITALKNLLKEFDKIIARKKANVVKKEAFKIEIDGQEYNSEEEIDEAIEFYSKHLADLEKDN